MYSDSNYTGAGNRYVAGDETPTDFKWSDLLTNSTLLTLLLRNGKIRKATSWVAREAIRPRFVLKKDNKVPGTKFGMPYTFDNVIEYLEWIGFFTELEKLYTWARLFGGAIIVMYKEGEGEQPHYNPLPLYDSLAAYYELANGNGYEIVKKDSDYVYKITLVDILGNSRSFTVDKKRVIAFNAPHLELTYKGSSDVEPMAKLAIVQEQMFRTIIKKLQEIGGGIDIFKVNSAEEKATIKTSISGALTYHNKLYTSDDPNMVLAQYIPEMKSDQFKTIWDISQEEIATDMNMTKKLISGDPEGATAASAQWDTEISYTEVYQTQRHYHKPTENVLFLLGIKDTTFVWNDPFPTEQTDETDDEDGGKSDKDGASKGKADGKGNTDGKSKGDAEGKAK